jgi:hypothetical protein
MDSIRTLVKLRDDESIHPGIRAACATHILDRAIGKPREIVDISTDVESSELVQALMVALSSGFLRQTRYLTIDGGSDDD